MCAYFHCVADYLHYQQVSFDEKAMKKTARIVEKAALRRDDPGAVDRVCDIVRAMVAL